MSAAPWSEVEHLRAQSLELFAQLTAWWDRLYWDGYGSLIRACLIIAAAGALFIIALVNTEDKDFELWSDVMSNGRWVGGVAVGAVVLVVWVSSQGAL